MQDEEQMTLTKRFVRIGWLCIAVVLAYMPSGSGDANLLVGWAFFVWTFPFSGLWWFYIYDVARQYMSPSVAQPMGSAFVIVLAYTFWFMLIPIIWHKAIHPHDAGRRKTPHESVTH